MIDIVIFQYFNYLSIPDVQHCVKQIDNMVSMD